MTPRFTVSLLGSLALASACTGPTYNTGVAGAPFVADPPAVYVAKVKNILVGLPPSDDEVTAVVNDPTALGGLVNQWMQLPQYQQKLLVFFELAFQQTQVGIADFKTIAPPNGYTGTQLPLVIQNAIESFAHTAIDITSRDQPFTDTFTTKQFMLTPALEQLYGYVDARTMDDAGHLDDQFSDQNPTLTIVIEASKGPIPLADSFDPTNANYMHFYNPDILTVTFPSSVCNGVDPISIDLPPLFGATNVMDVLYGQIPQHTVSGVVCPGRAGIHGQQLDPSDFTTWKSVTIRQPNPGEAKTRFFDVVTMRSSNELVLDIPRVGFFTTPAFNANWPTNSGNQMRGPLNQTLIVATGHQIDGTDGTIPSSTPGLSSDHVAPDSTCYGCHQLLDPTRSILSATYSWSFSPQTDPQLVNQPGLFAFQHVVAPMATIDDFAQLLATHPLVPAAWVQKLCYYVNSAPCDPADPEFQRIVNEFVTSNYSWNGLIRNIFTSPITTNASATKTHDTNGEVISVSRRDHLCAAINNRLGFNDICLTSLADPPALGVGPIAAIISGMPADAYGRGGTAPILPNDPTLFYRGALENVCAYLAQATVDAAPDANQPNAKRWVSTDPTTAIGEFVSLVMAMTPSDPRSQLAIAALTDHFQAATQTGASATDALRSTFVTACLSPSFAGIGM